MKTDYEFRGYYTGVGGSGDKYINADGTPAREYFLTTDVILYAYWYQNTHVVTLHSVGADDEGTTSAVAVVGLNFPNISAPTRTGYLFAGYYTGVNGSGTQYVDSSGNGTRNYDIDSDTILYAKWISLNGITIVDCGTDSEGCLVWIFDSVNQLSIFGSCGIPDYSKNNSPWHSYGNSIETIEIGSTISSIGTYAFYGCTSLVTLHIGANVSSIGTYAFSGCTSLEDLVIPDSVTSLGSMCFENCTGLRSLTIPISLRASDYGYSTVYYFSGCTGITDLHLTVGNGTGASYNHSDYGCRDYQRLPWYLSASSLTTVTIDDGITSIGPYMFYGCSAITDINIPFSLRTIANNSFNSITFCDELGNPLPNSSTYYGYSYSGSSGTLLRVSNSNFHVVYFESVGGSYISPQETYVGYRIMAPSNPTMTGYTFNGWYLSESLYDFNTPVSGDVTLVAHWTINKYVVAFDSAGGSIIPNQNVEYQSTAMRPADPEYTRYSFICWTLNGSEYDFSTLVTQNITLVATWSLNTYTVSFNSNGGTSVNSQIVDSHMSAIRPQNPTKIGYNFVNWTLDGSVYDFSTPVMSDLNLVATWSIQTFNITFNSNGGSSVDSQVVEYGSTIARPQDPSYYAYVFANWLYNGSVYDFSTPVSKNMTLTASWIPLANRTITFNSVGGSAVSSQTVLTGECVIKPLDPSREGYTFQHWNYNGSEYDFGTKVISDMVLDAVWSRIMFQVSFDSNGGSSVPTQTVGYGDTASIPNEPSRTGYYFTQWTLNGVAYEFSHPVYSDLVIKANWGTYHYTVTFETGEGSEVASQSVEAGSVAVRPADPVREGYSFSDWLLNGYSYDFSTPVVTDITITAYWIATKYTITFDSNGGSEVPSQYLTYGSRVIRPQDPTRDGYNFSEWKVNGQTYFFNVNVTSDLTITAIWTDVDKVTITFNTDGGSAVSSQIVKIGDTIILPEDPVKSGYIFAGWLVNGQPYDASQPLTANCMLTASWISEEDAKDDGIDTTTIIMIAVVAALTAGLVGLFALRGSRDVFKQIDKLQIKPPGGGY